MSGGVVGRGQKGREGPLFVTTKVGKPNDREVTPLAWPRQEP
jgi:hypothetical protein